MTTPSRSTDGPRSCRRLWAPLLASALVGVGCSSPPSSQAAEGGESAAAAAIEARRQQLRDELRVRLGDRYDAPLPASTEEDLAKGRELYDLLCRACHGPTGRGNGRSARSLALPPPDLADPRVAAFFSEQAKLAIVAEGVAGTPMIGWGAVLSEQERIQVLQFMNTMVKSEEPQSR